jgi:hypothetical protein
MEETMRNENRGKRHSRLKWPIVAGWVCTLLVAGLLAGCAPSQDRISSTTMDPNDELEAMWGVRVESIRSSAVGHLVDFRYRVIDPDKAATLIQRGQEAYLMDEATGTKLPVPVTKVGQLRGTGTKHQENRVYTVMFNTGGGGGQTGQHGDRRYRRF